ncbi:hypothetical protein CAPTEDRAFT_219155 [Capitella teleta]|uniref:MDN2-binding protein C-terminal domain-containing protein n=1 Tax=Capitella teleta TaxID=283909 RepID=R7TYH9_CAPTE|nr:hypothetical protein CAPTEDRAFT_219155 [Capitella teleta]|eukprot:ELT98682.1 hypothetical protein CAPTEDRAFT_219155 [Capitella teleta]
MWSLAASRRKKNRFTVGRVYKPCPIICANTDSSPSRSVAYTLGTLVCRNCSATRGELALTDKSDVATSIAKSYLEVQRPQLHEDLLYHTVSSRASFLRAESGWTVANDEQDEIIPHVDLNALHSDELLSSEVFALNESLTKHDNIVDVVLIYDHENIPSIDHFILLCGSLLYLREWLNASLILIHSGEETCHPDALTPWSRLLRAGIWSSCNLTQVPRIGNCLWRGTLALNVERSETKFSGFSIEHMNSEDSLSKASDKIFSRPLAKVMEAVASVSRSLVPSHLIDTNSIYEFKVISQKEFSAKQHKISNRLHESPETCLLVRIPLVRTESQSTTAAAASWNESISRDCSQIPRLPNIDHTGVYQYFLLASDNRAVIALPMVNPNDLLPITFETKRVEISNEMQFLNLIPKINSVDFLRDLETQRLKLALKTIGDPKFDKEVYDNLWRELISRHEGIPFAQDDLQRMTLEAKIAEFTQDSDQLIQRSCLVNRCCESIRVPRQKSSESLGGLSPPTKGNYVTLDAKEFLKCFNPDGTAARENLSQILCKKRKRMKMSSSRPADVNVWPKSLNVCYHDVYYNRDNSAEETPRQHRWTSCRLSETTSTCTSAEQAHSPAIMPVTRVTHDVTDTSPAVRKRSKPSPDVQKSRNTKSERQKRSQRHNMILKEVVCSVLRKQDIDKKNPIFKSCAQRLFTITKTYVKDLNSSRNLKQEMEKISQQHVSHVVSFEKDRQSTN